MKIEIEIPKAFEEHFKQDKFKDSFERIMADLKNCLCAGNYEYETIEMLQKAFENSRKAYSVDKVIEELELHSFELGTDTLPVHYVRLNDAIEIVKQGGDDNDVCECRKLKDYRSLFKTSCGYIFAREGFKYCPYCGNKIKIVGD